MAPFTDGLKFLSWIDVTKRLAEQMTVAPDLGSNISTFGFCSWKRRAFKEHMPRRRLQL
jgi:hypothetical protein